MNRQRARRAEHAREVARRERPKQIAKYTAYVVAGILIVAGAAYGFMLLPDPPKRVHWHTQWLLIVEGEEVVMSHPKFDGMMGSGPHIHLPNYRTLHFEGKLDRGVQLGLFFKRALDGELTDDRIILPPETNKQGVFEETGNNTLFAYLQPGGQGNWTEYSGSLPKYLPKQDKDRLLIMYGNYTVDEIAAAQERVPTP